MEGCAGRKKIFCFCSEAGHKKIIAKVTHRTCWLSICAVSTGMEQNDPWLQYLPLDTTFKSMDQNEQHIYSITTSSFRHTSMNTKKQQQETSTTRLLTTSSPSSQQRCMQCTHLNLSPFLARRHVSTKIMDLVSPNRLPPVTKRL